MGDIYSAVRDDEDEYLRLCRQYGEQPRYRDKFGQEDLDVYGPHADRLKARHRAATTNKGIVSGPTNRNNPKEKMMTDFSKSFADKFMGRMFRKADGVVWDLSSGKLGIRTNEGIATLAGEGEEAQVVVNMFDQFGIEVPAFAQSTPIEQVNVGDVIYFGASERPGWVVQKITATPKAARGKAAAAATAPVVDDKAIAFYVMKPDGQRTRWNPPKIELMGMGDSGVMVLRSLVNLLPGGQTGLDGMNGQLATMMQMSMLAGGDGKFDIEGILPMLLMGQMGGGNQGGNMMQTMLMMQMMKGGGFGGGKGGAGGFFRQ